MNVNDHKNQNLGEETVWTVVPMVSMVNIGSNQLKKGA